MTTLTAAPVKEIKYDVEARDYAMYLDGELVGFKSTYHLAEIELDRLAYEQLDRAGVEPELLQSATALDGQCQCGTTFNEYGQCEVCIALRERLLAIITTDEPVLARLLTTDDQPAIDPGHDITLPDPAECPSTTEPQPCEDLPTCFILPTGTTAQSIILCIGGVSRVVSACGVAEALTLASVHQVR